MLRKCIRPANLLPETLPERHILHITNKSEPDNDQKYCVQHHKPNIRHKIREGVQHIKQGTKVAKKEHARVVEDQRMVDGSQKTEGKQGRNSHKGKDQTSDTEHRDGANRVGEREAQAGPERHKQMPET
ncbi:hypothetical protein BC629DRAFT_1524860 [Irpex lacteus]|nr:hypothetical protein BC629DRAFT_1537870 [Irpex lacteus]KAI0777038.1 hypothetical protein BC629DRAFT_1524860 [Irpex lacteus]